MNLKLDEKTFIRQNKIYIKKKTILFYGYALKVMQSNKLIYTK